METNLLYCTRTGRTISEKTMEDGNDANVNNEKIHGTPFSNIYSERYEKLTTNGYDNPGESSSPSNQPYEPRRSNVDISQDEKFRQRINPLRIHLGKRPFVENSLTYNSASKRKKPYVVKHSDTSISKNSVPRLPKLIPKRGDHGQFHNPKLHVDNTLESERDKPVPRLVPKSHLSQYKKGKTEKGPQLKEYAQSLGLQPMVKFKCRKCCSMSFKTLAMLKEHQLICRAQAKEPALSPEATCTDTKQNTSGPSRVTRKVYLCSACGTYYENWNLFLHMRDVHNRHICLFCLGMFSKAEKLSSHLTNKHNVQEFNFNSKDEFSHVYNGTFYLMCCACEEICCEKDDYFNHDCNNVKPKPVPVLVSKNSLKPNNVKSVKQDGANGHAVRSLIQTISDKKDFDEQKAEATLQSQNIFNNKNNIDTCDTSMSSMNSSESVSRTANDSVDGIYEQENHIEKPSVSPKYHVTQPILSNGDEYLDHSEDSDSHDAHQDQTLDLKVPKLIVKSPQQIIEKEKEGGIKLKLSLNNANSPVIINSTVDPTVGQNYAHKPPSRNRRPPKRYEKDKPPDTYTPVKPVDTYTPVKPPDSFTPVKPPSIKMTICDRADSPFVKTTIYENNKETIVKTLINNNIESTSVKSSDNKSDSTIKTTIYDNKFEDENTLNRVPKLTVRVPKEFLDKDSSSDYSSDSDASEKLTVDDKNITVEHKNEENEEPIPETTTEPATSSQITNEDTPDQVNLQSHVTEEKQEPAESIAAAVEPKPEPNMDVDVTDDINVDETEPVDDIPVTELTLDRPLDRYPLKDLLKVFLSSTMFNCIYCNHGRVIAVNCEQLALHMVAQHRFAATVDSITAEELMPETIIAKLKSGAEELNTVYINLDTYDSVDKCDKMTFNQLFECFQCYFKTAVHKDLYLHNRKMHQKTILLCVMCKNNFYTYSELICHLCPGTYDSDYEIRFRCCFCTVDTISSSFRLMVHLRKIHHTCDVCLEFCQSQARLSNHVWKHKLHHLCYRCGIAYRNKPDINNHLFWKHGTESVVCKKCLQKKWPHVYHFCTPPAVFACDECTLQFTRAVCLKVHKRFHSEEYPHLCTEDGCTEKFVSKKLLNKHLEEHRKKLFTEDLNEEKPSLLSETITDGQKEQTPVIDLVDEKPKDDIENKTDTVTEQVSKKSKKKKMKEKDALLLEVDLPALNLSESDSSDESDTGQSQSVKNEKTDDVTTENDSQEIKSETTDNERKNDDKNTDSVETPLPKEDKTEPLEEKPSEQTVLEIWDNFKKYQAKVEKHKEKTPPLVPIKKHVCESDHDYCLVPTDLNGDDEGISSDKKKSKKSPRKRHGGLSSSSSSSSDSDSSCSCGSNCSCSSSSGSSSSSSSDSDSSDESGNEKKKNKQLKKSLPNRRLSNGSNVDVMGMSETPVLAPEKTEPPIAETDLETDESETDEEFYDKNPQQIANKAYNEKRNQMLHSVSEGGSVSGNVSRCTTPIKEEEEVQKKVEPDLPPTDLRTEEIKPELDIKDKTSSSKKKSKKKKKSKSSRKHGPIKINIPKDIIRTEPEIEEPTSLIPNKITISLQTNTVQIPEPPTAIVTPNMATKVSAAVEKKRSSKRRRVPNKFYGYSSDEEGPNTTMAALKPQQPPKLEWRKEDLPSPVTHKTKKEMPSMAPQRLFNYNEPIRFSAPPVPDPEPPKILMNSESLESSDSDSSDEGALQIHQPSVQNSIPVPPPTYLNSGTSSLPYPFQRPAVRQAREGESVYCYCRCPYDEVSEMIACDAEGCPIEWFHFECVGIMVPPKGKWYCPECRKNQSFSGYR